MNMNMSIRTNLMFFKLPDINRMFKFNKNKLSKDTVFFDIYKRIIDIIVVIIIKLLIISLLFFILHDSNYYRIKA